MKKTMAICMMFFLGFSLEAQDDPLVDLFIDFSTQDSALWIDPSLPNNQWEIGIPDKQGFDSAYSSPYAICTSLDEHYISNNTSSFLLTMISERFGSGLLEFAHMVNSETYNAGGYIEISYDQGNTWNNLVYESNWRTNFYESDDLIFNDEPAFSGISDGWKNVKFNFLWYALTKQINSWPNGWGLGNYGDADTLLLKFSFKSNSSAVGQPGWLIDDINFKIFDISGGSQNWHIPEYKILYSPKKNEVLIKNINGFTEKYSVILFDMLGRKRIVGRSSPLEINTAGLESGIYFLMILRDGTNPITEKVLILQP